MGDLWAGAEVQMVSLISQLATRPEFQFSVVLFNEGTAARRLREVGVPVTTIPEESSGPMALVRRLSAHFGEVRYDVLHTHKYKDTVLAALASIGKVGLRVRTVHGSPEPFEGTQALKMRLYGVLDRGATRFADRVVAVSQRLRAELAETYPAERLRCIHNGIDVDSQRTPLQPPIDREQLGISNDEVAIGVVGRLTAVKGVDVFLDAARNIADVNRAVRFVVIGDGPLRPTLERQAAENGLSERVVFLGHRDDAARIVGALDLLVIPSRSEGIPMVLLEALASETPVVASRVGGIPEVMEHQRHGLLCEPGDTVSLAGECLKLIADRDTARALASAGLRRVEEEFSASLMASRYAAIYQQRSE